MSQNQSVEQPGRKVTAAERLFARSPFAIVTMILPIKGHVSEEMLKQAVTRVQQRHALLSVRIESDTDHALRFTPEGVQEIPSDRSKAKPGSTCTRGRGG